MKQIDQVLESLLSSEHHRTFINEVVLQYPNRESRRGRKTVDIPVLIVLQGTSTLKSGIIKCLKPRRDKKEGKKVLEAHVTIPGGRNIYAVPLCSEGQVLEYAGLHAQSPLFCITSSDFGLYKEEKEHIQSCEFYYIRQLVEEVHSKDYEAIEHIAKLMTDYVKKYK